MCPYIYPGKIQQGDSFIEVLAGLPDGHRVGLDGIEETLN